MRLTLRTMLAYMDGILEPADAEDIRKKIDESETATKIYQRIRDVVRRVRLSAPSINERGANLDANGVAEYLDNILPADRVPDFEKDCLESDVMLAEVTACHQILTLVLGEPAEIDQEGRQRMYRLPEVAARARSESAAATSHARPSEDGPEDAAKKNLKYMVPEYLREPRRRGRWLTAAALLVLAGCLAGVTLFALGQFEPGMPIRNFWDRIHPPAEVAANPQPGDHAGNGTEKNPTADEPVKTDMTPSAAPEIKGGTPAGDQPPGPGAVEVPAPNKEPAVKTPEVKPAAEIAKPEPGKPDAKSLEVPSPAKPDAVLPAAVKEPAAKESPKESVAKIDAPVAHEDPGAIAKPEAKPLEPLAKLDPSKSTAPETMPGIIEPNKPQPPEVVAQRMGRFISDSQEVLLKYDKGGALWLRVPAEEFLVAREELLSLPAFRPRIVLSTIAAIDLVGGTRLSLLSEGPDGPVGIDIAAGRVVIKPLAQPGGRLRLSTGGPAGVLTLVEPESVAAVSVTHQHAPGADPESETRPLSVELYVSQGEVEWTETAGKKPLRVVAPARLVLAPPAASPTPVPVGEIPKWIVAEPIGPLDRRAAITLAQALPTTRPASLSLAELTDHRQREVCWLAARCLGYLGQFDTMVAALNDVGKKTVWPDYIEQLRGAIARDTATAKAVRRAFQQHYGEEADALFRMLWGYTDKGLLDGDDARLVKSLEHETLAFRVLAFWNLRDITGLGLFYRPELPAARRQQSLARWQQRQAAGEIRIKSAEEKSNLTPDVAPLPPDEQEPKAPEKAPEKTSEKGPEKLPEIAPE